LPHKIKRIKKGLEIKAALRGERKGSYLFDIYKKNNELGHSRFAVITRKTLGKANKRNKIKRRLMGIINTLRNEINNIGDIIIIPKKGILEHKVSEILYEIKKKLTANE
jgi:ribonuclease P protein component